MRNKARLFRICTYFLIAMIMSTMLILPACSESSTETTTGPESSTETTTDSITVCFPMSNPESLDYTSSKSGTSTQWLVSDIFDRLADWDYAGQVEPRLATWEVLDDGKCYEFTIREGITFTSGDPLTASDVEFSWNRTMENVPQFSGLLMGNFDHLEVVDDYTVRFYLKKPSVNFLTINIPMFLVASKSYYDRVGEEEFKANPVGTGPYKFVAWEQGQYVDLERNDDYWGEKPQFKYVRLVWSSEPSTSVAMLKAGEVDFLVEADWAIVPELEEAGFNSVKFSPMLTYALQFDSLNPDVPWVDLRVRQAINYAIDKEAVINTVFQGVPEEAAGWLASWEVGYDSSLGDPVYPYDLEEAKDLLAEAGYADGFTMPLYTGSIYGPNASALAEYLILALREVNIDVELNILEGPAIYDFLRSAHTDTSAEVTLVSAEILANAPDPTFGLSTNFYSGGAQSIYYTPELDVLIEEASTTMDDTERGELIKQIYEIIDADLPVVPICTNSLVYVMQPNMDYHHRGRLPAFFYVSEITIE